MWYFVSRKLNDILRSRVDITDLPASNVQAVLVGESLMRASSPSQAVALLCGSDVESPLVKVLWRMQCIGIAL